MDAGFRNSREQLFVAYMIPGWLMNVSKQMGHRIIYFHHLAIHKEMYVRWPYLTNLQNNEFTST